MAISKDYQKGYIASMDKITGIFKEKLKDANWLLEHGTSGLIEIKELLLKKKIFIELIEAIEQDKKESVDNYNKAVEKIRKRTVTITADEMAKGMSSGFPRFKRNR